MKFRETYMGKWSMFEKEGNVPLLATVLGSETMAKSPYLTLPYLTVVGYEVGL